MRTSPLTSQKTIATDPEAEWVFVVDQLNIHQSEALVKLVAKECGIELELDRKGNLKHIKAMASRRTFLQNPTHRIRFVYTPKHTSWLNQIELWFSILSRKLLKRGSFASVEELHQRSWSSLSTSTELWPNRSSGPTRADRSRSKPMGYFHRDALR